jgi:hypothetical protein
MMLIGYGMSKSAALTSGRYSQFDGGKHARDHLLLKGGLHRPFFAQWSQRDGFIQSKFPEHQREQTWVEEPKRVMPKTLIFN